LLEKAVTKDELLKERGWGEVNRKKAANVDSLYI
jgi:hypothetical protein